MLRNTWWTETTNCLFVLLYVHSEVIYIKNEEILLSRERICGYIVGCWSHFLQKYVSFPADLRFFPMTPSHPHRPCFLNSSIYVALPSDSPALPANVQYAFTILLLNIASKWFLVFSLSAFPSRNQFFYVKQPFLTRTYLGCVKGSSLHIWKITLHLKAPDTSRQAFSSSKLGITNAIPTL